MQAKEYLWALLARIQRRWPTVSGYWRLEYQERGAAHFHLVLFGLPWWDKSDLQRVWGGIVGEVRPFTRIEAVRHWRGVLAYVGKYLGKRGPGLDSSAYLDASPGRFWGTFNEKCIPVAVLTCRVLPFGDGKWFHAVRRSARRKWAGVSRRYGCGFTLYTDRPDVWMHYLVATAGVDYA